MVAGPTGRQLAYLRRGVEQAGGKLPLFDEFGQEYGVETIRSCMRKGWAEPWFENPIHPNWLVCRITEQGLLAVAEAIEKAREKQKVTSSL